MVNRKGVGYILEVTVAMMVLIVFVVGNSVISPSQDWTEHQNEITAQDLTYTLKESGDLEKFIQRREPGSLETAVSTITPRDIEVSGAIEGLPLNEIYMGFHTSESDRHTPSLLEDMNEDQCYQEGQLDELSSRGDGGDPEIRRSEDTKHGVYLYLVDIDPADFGDDSGLDKGLWVDNGTRCQFADEDGPYLQDEFFKWGDSDEDEYAFYEFKDADFDTSDFTVHNSTHIMPIKEMLETPLNSINTAQEFETFIFDEKDIEEYDIISFYGQDSIEEMNTEETEDVENFIENNPVLLIADIADELNQGFLSGTGLEQIDAEVEEDPGLPVFDSNSNSQELELYFKGLDGETSDINIENTEQISSSNPGEASTLPLLYDNTQYYDTSEWDSENTGMEEIDPGSVEGVPESACVEEDEDYAVTHGSFTFDNSGETYEVISTDMATDSDDCGNLRALNIDLNGDSDFSDKGPVLTGESAEIDGQDYNVFIEDESEARFEFDATRQVEIITYRDSFEEFSGERLAHIPYQEEYNQEETKLIASVIYWLIREDMEFGEDDYSTSSSIVGSINDETSIPYRASIRWR